VNGAYASGILTVNAVIAVAITARRRKCLRSLECRASRRCLSLIDNTQGTQILKLVFMVKPQALCGQLAGHNRDTLAIKKHLVRYPEVQR
jgi:hypothetical protein